MSDIVSADVTCDAAEPLADVEPPSSTTNEGYIKSCIRLEHLYNWV